MSVERSAQWQYTQWTVLHWSLQSQGLALLVVNSVVGKGWGSPLNFCLLENFFLSIFFEKYEILGWKFSFLGWFRGKIEILSGHKCIRYLQLSLENCIFSTFTPHPFSQLFFISRCCCLLLECFALLYFVSDNALSCYTEISKFYCLTLAIYPTSYSCEYISGLVLQAVRCFEFDSLMWRLFSVHWRYAVYRQIADFFSPCRKWCLSWSTACLK